MEKLSEKEKEELRMRLLENARNAHLYKDPNTEEYKKEAQKERNKIEAEQMKVLT